jgi:hypothetical protein
MSIYNTIAFTTKTFRRDSFWSDIAAEAYPDNPGGYKFANQIIAFNYNEIDEADRQALYISKEYTLKVPVLSDEFEDLSDLPTWRGGEDANSDF